jgi:hypothetical protein
MSLSLIPARSIMALRGAKFFSIKRSRSKTLFRVLRLPAGIEEAFGETF